MQLTTNTFYSAVYCNSGAMENDSITREDVIYRVNGQDEIAFNMLDRVRTGRAVTFAFPQSGIAPCFDLF